MSPTTPTVGYYVHHHGAGHATRFGRIRGAWPSQVVLTALSQLALPDVVALPSDVTSAGGDPTAGGSLHWAPVGDPGLARRAAVVVQWCADHAPLGVVVDVSCEAALLCRLAGVRTVVVRQHGERSDAAHTAAYRSAARLLAPFPVHLEAPTTPDWVVTKTDYCGFLDPPARPALPPPAALDVSSDDLVVVSGAGGGRLPTGQLAILARIAAPHRLVVVGEPRDDVSSTNVVMTGWLDDVAPLLHDSPVVVASAGNNAVADVAFAGCALVAVAYDRPFDEQLHHARSLCAAGAAVVATGTETEREWRRLLDDARSRRPTLAALAVPGGSRRAAEAILAAFTDASARNVADTAADIDAAVGTVA